MPSLQLPASITARQRALLHAVAEAHGLGHASSGEGSERRMSIGDGVKVRRFPYYHDPPLDSLSKLRRFFTVKRRL